MKRLAFLLSVVLVLSMLLTSCEYIDSFLDLFEAEPETADELWERIDEEMDELDSYTATTAARLDYEMQGVKVKGNLKVTMKEIGDAGDDDYYAYLYSMTDIYIGGSLTTETEATIVYQDGKMYLSNTSSDASSRLVSEISAEDFVNYISGEKEYFEFPVDNASDKEMRRRGDDKWELTFSISDKDELATMLEELKFDKKSLGISITEISVEIVADEDYRADEINVTFYSGEDDVITMSARYGSFNAVEKIDIDESKYNEVDDIFVAIALEECLDSALDAEEIGFTVEINQQVRDGGFQNIRYVYGEKDIVKAYNKNGAFTYSIAAYIDGEEYSVEYAYGTQTVSGPDIHEATAQSTLEARAFLMNLIDPTDFSLMNVTEIEQYSDGRYKIVVEPTNITEYRQFMISIGDTCVESKFYIVVELDGESVESFKTCIVITGKLYVVTAECMVEIDK